MNHEPYNLETKVFSEKKTFVCSLRARKHSMDVKNPRQCAMRYLFSVTLNMMCVYKLYFTTQMTATTVILSIITLQFNSPH